MANTNKDGTTDTENLKWTTALSTRDSSSKGIFTDKENSSIQTYNNLDPGRLLQSSVGIRQNDKWIVHFQ